MFTRVSRQHCALVRPWRVHQFCRMDAHLLSMRHIVPRQSRSVASCLSGSTDLMRGFKDRLRPLGPGGISLSLDDENGLATLVLDNHERRNALSGKMMAQLADAVDELERWDTGVALVVHGAGGSFCAGADLSMAREHLITGTDGRVMCALMSDTLTRLRSLPLISVAAIDGAAIGGGAELCTSCDFRVAGPDSSIRFVQVKMGVSTGWGGGARLASIVGRRAALRLLGWSPSIAADEGLAIGLLDARLPLLLGYVAPPCRAGRLFRVVAEAVRAVKNVVAAADHPVSEQLRRAEEDHFSALWGAAHNRSRVRQLRFLVTPSFFLSLQFWQGGMLSPPAFWHELCCCSASKRSHRRA
ncbi:unnamed protein product [Scytosiphon promiscuus]